MKFNTRKIVFIGLFVSISIILTRILSFYPIPTIRISFGDIPIMMSGLLFGPAAGAVTGALSDLIGVLMFPSPTGVSYFPGFTLSKILVGILPAVIFRYLKGKMIVKLMISIIITEIICSLTLDTLWLSMLYHKGMFILLPTRIISRVIIIVGEIPLIHIIFERLNKTNIIDNN